MTDELGRLLALDDSNAGIATSGLRETRQAVASWLVDAAAVRSAIREAEAEAADRRSIRRRSAPVACPAGGISYPTRPRR